MSWENVNLWKQMQMSSEVAKLHSSKNYFFDKKLHKIFSSKSLVISPLRISRLQYYGDANSFEKKKNYAAYSCDLVIEKSGCTQLYVKLECW
jgi:hypothetical protein